MASSLKGNRKVAEMRAQKDLTEMDVVPGIEMMFPNVDDICFFRVAVTPLEGDYKGARFGFTFSIPEDFPYSAPKVRLETVPIFHPNIDWNGHVCLSILREDWSPVLSISSVLFGLLLLFHEPNPAEPLNEQASILLQTDPRRFHDVVRQTLEGGSFFGREFPNLTAK